MHNIARHCLRTSTDWKLAVVSLTYGIRAAQRAQISVRTFLAVSLLVNSLQNGGGPPPILPLRVRVLLLTSCTTGALTNAKNPKSLTRGLKSTLVYGYGRLWHRVARGKCVGVDLWSGNMERSYSQLRHRVPYTMFLFGFGLCMVSQEPTQTVKIVVRVPKLH
jgi:hypothetical protein